MPVDTSTQHPSAPHDSLLTARLRSERFFHVTPAHNRAGIETHGLLIDPPTRNYRTRRAIYLGTTAPATAPQEPTPAGDPALTAVHRWAAEIGNHLNYHGPYAVFGVTPTDPALVASTTEHGTQSTARRNIPPTAVRYLGEITVAPRPGPRTFPT